MPCDVLHDDVHRAAVFDEVVDVQDVLVLERRHEVRLALEALGELAVDRDRRLEGLDRYDPAERLLDGLVDDRHAAAADLSEDAAVTDALNHAAERMVAERSGVVSNRSRWNSRALGDR